MNLNLGCGQHKLPNCNNVDFNELTNPDEIADLNEVWPWKNNSVENVFTSHTIEHLDSTIHFIKEVYRVCKNNAIIEIRVPYFAGLTAFSDPTHRNFYGSRTFNNWDVNQQEYRTNLGLEARFKIMKKKLSYIPNNVQKRGCLNLKSNTASLINIIVNPFVNLIPIGFYEKVIAPFFPCGEIYYKLKVVKPS